MPYAERARRRPSRSKGRREAKQAEMASRPGFVLEALWQEPMTSQQVGALVGFKAGAKSKSTCYILSELKKNNQAVDVQIGNVRLWVATGSPAEVECKRMQAEHLCKRQEQEKARAKARWAQKAKTLHADSWAEQPPKRLIKSAGEWKTMIPPRAVRSVFDLAVV